VAAGDGKRGEFVSDVFEGKFEALSEAGGVFDGVEPIGEIFSHFGVALEMSLRIAGQEFARGVEMGVLADTGEDVENLAAIRAGILHAVRGNNRQAEMFRQIAEFLVTAIFPAEKMPLNFDVDVIAAEDADKSLRTFGKTPGSARVSRVGDGVSPSRTFERLFRRDAKTNARDARATQELGDEMAITG